MQNEKRLTACDELETLRVFLNDELQGMVVEASASKGYVRKLDYSDGIISKRDLQGKVKITYQGMNADFVRIEEGGNAVYVLFPT